jgi:preprotein translocase subunit Sss1
MAGAMAAEYSYVVEYRRCLRARGITYPIAVCTTCKKVVKPTREEYSKTGAHGVWYYKHEHQLSFIILEQSNSEKRRVTVQGSLPGRLEDAVRSTWLFHRYEPEDIERILAELLPLAVSLQ